MREGQEGGERAGSVVVKRDGQVIHSCDSENAAFAWLQRHQPQSVDWALRYEGYSIESVEPGSQP